MVFELHFFHLWFPLCIIYASIWIYMLYIGKKIGRPIEDPEIYSVQSKQTRFIFGFLPTLFLFAVSFFVPIHWDIYFIVGLIFALIGLYFNLICFNAFAYNPNPLNTKGIYKYSRNPMYVSGLLIFLGLGIMGFGNGFISYVFLFFILVWAFSTHYIVLYEEKFLEKKYGDEFLAYKEKVNRYF